MEILKENISINKRAAKESVQILLEGDIVLSDSKPDIEKILETSESTYIDSYEINNERISFKGRADIEILYQAKDTDKKVQNMSAAVDINDFINIDGIDGEMNAVVCCDVINADYELINDRKIGYRIICRVTAELIKNENMEIVKGIDGIDESQIRKQKYKINDIVCCKEEKFTIKDEIAISGGRPNIDEILSCRVSIGERNVKIGKDSAEISGILRVSTLYRSDEEINVVNYIENEIPFNGSVEAENAREGMTAEIIMNIPEKTINAMNDEDGEKRIIDVEAVVKCIIKCYEEKEVEIFDDGYCINKVIDTQREEIEYAGLVCRNKNQFPIKDIIRLDESAESILQIIKASGNVFIDEIKIIEDKICIEGMVKVDILYAANSDENPICCYEAEIPYKQTIETKGTKNSGVNYANIDVNAEHISVNMISDKEVEVRCVISFDTYAFEKNKVGVVTGILFDDIDKDVLDRIPSMVIYIVQKGDTLWKLAKKFNTSVEDIARINDIEDPDMIYPEQKLLILKRVE